MTEPGDDLAGLTLPDEGPGKSSGRRWLIALVVLAAVGAAGWHFLGQRFVTHVVKTTEVKLFTAEAATTKLTAIGYVQPKQRTLVTAKAASRISKIVVQEGQTIKEGDTIAVLDSEDLKAAVAEAEAALATSKARVRGVRASLAEARMSLQRETTLFRSGSTGKASMDAAQSKLNVSSAAVAAASAEVLSAEARLRRAKVGLASTEVVAPMSGRVLKRLASEGEMVGGGSSAIVELVDPSTMYVDADVSERKIGEISVGGPVLIALDAFPTKRFRAVVDTIQSAVDRQKATITVRMRLLGDNPSILPQMTAKASFLTRTLTDAELARPPVAVVAAAAIADRGGAKTLFVVENKHVIVTKVDVGAQAGNDQVEINDGPAPGTKVVLNPPEFLNHGDAVKEQP